MIARGLIGRYHRDIVVWGGGLMECKEKLTQQMSALQLKLMIAKGHIGVCHRVIVVWGGGLMEYKEELKQQMSALQGELDDSKRAYRWIS